MALKQKIQFVRLQDAAAAGLVIDKFPETCGNNHRETKGVIGNQQTTIMTTTKQTLELASLGRKLLKKGKIQAMIL